MPRTITKEHQWTGAVWVDLDDKQARYATHRGNVKITAGVMVDVCEITCAMCRRRYEDVADIPCPAGIDNSHLRGGDPEGKRHRGRGGEEDAVAAGD